MKRQYQVNSGFTLEISLIIMPIQHNIDYILEIFPIKHQYCTNMVKFLFFSFGMSILRIFTGLHFKLNCCNIRFKYWIYMAKCIEIIHAITESMHQYLANIYAILVGYGDIIHVTTFYNITFRVQKQFTEEDCCCKIHHIFNSI